MEKIYTKCSIERAAKFSIITDIINDGNDFHVEKRPYTPAAQPHIDNIMNSFQRAAEVLKNSSVRYICCEQSKNGALCFEYVDGQTLEEIADGYLAAGNVENVLRLIDKLIQWLYEYSEPQEKISNQDFQMVFGSVDFPDGTMCAKLGNIDLILPNIIVNDGYKIIDYEWTFPFAIPTKFIVYRILYQYIFESESHLKALEPYCLFDRYEISQKEIDLFGGMEGSFQKYIKGESMSLKDVGASLIKDNIPINEAVENEMDLIRHNRMEIYLDFGKGYEMAEQYVFDNNITYNGLRILNVKLRGDAKGMIVIPAKKGCIVKIEECVSDDGHDCKIHWCHEAICMSNGVYLLESGENNFEVDFPLGAACVHLEMKAWYVNQELLQCIVQEKKMSVERETWGRELQRKQEEMIQALSHQLDGEKTRNLVLIDKIRELRGCEQEDK